MKTILLKEHFIYTFQSVIYYRPHSEYIILDGLYYAIQIITLITSNSGKSIIVSLKNLYYVS